MKVPFCKKDYDISLVASLILYDSLEKEVDHLMKYVVTIDITMAPFLTFLQSSRLIIILVILLLKHQKLLS